MLGRWREAIARCQIVIVRSTKQLHDRMSAIHASMLLSIMFIYRFAHRRMRVLVRAEDVKHHQEVTSFKVRFQKKNGQRLLLEDDLSVHIVKPQQPTVDSLMIACCVEASTTTGRILEGASGPEVNSDEQLKPTLYFRSNEDKDSLSDEDLPPSGLEELPGLDSSPPTNRLQPPPQQTQQGESTDVDACVVVSSGSKPVDVNVNFSHLVRVIKRRKLKEHGRDEYSATSIGSQDLTTAPNLSESIPEVAQASQSERGMNIKDDVLNLKDVTVGEEISEVAEGIVYHGTWLTSPVAIKVIRGQSTGTELDECNFLRKLAHPNVVQFFGIYQINPKKLGIVVEICDQDLLDYSAKDYGLRSQAGKPRPTQRMLLKCVKDALCGLVFVHDRGLIHLDIKPSNILVKGGIGKLADFGLASLSGKLKTTTQTVTWPGTGIYRAPELYETRTPPSTACDVWSMAITLLEVMTGQSPFEPALFRRNGMQKPEPLKKQELPRPLALVGAINREIYSAALSYNKQARMSAREWLKELTKYEIQDGS